MITAEMVSKAVAKMKVGKAAGPFGIIAEMLKAAGDLCYPMLADLAKIYNHEIPSDWENSFIINLYKGKGDALDRGNYRGLKLHEQTMKVVERIVETLIRDSIPIDGMKFGFMTDRGTKDAILRQLQEKFDCVP